MINGLRTKITIASYEILRCPWLEVTYRRHFPLSRACIVVPDPKGEFFRHLSEGDQVEVKFGYRNGPEGEWRGTVEAFGAKGSKDQIMVRAAGIERPLSETLITQSWEQEDPAAIVRFALAQAGLPQGRIDSPGVIFPRFVASAASVWKLARQCEHTCRHAFGLDMSKWALWVSGTGRANWGDFDEPEEVPVIATGAGLIEHLPAASAFELGKVETVLIPEFRASRLFRLRDRRRQVDALFRALEVRHTIAPDSARTHIGYGGEYARS